MAAGWEWPYVGKTCSDLFPRTQSAIHHRTTAVRSSYCDEDEGTERRFPSAFPVSFYLHARRKVLSILSFRRGKDFSGFRRWEKDWLRFKIGRDCFLEWWGISVGDILTGSMADRRAHAIWRPLPFSVLFWIIWIVCFFFLIREFGVFWLIVWISWLSLRCNVAFYIVE